MKYIREHENFKRGYYTGIFLACGQSQVRSSVMIRTLVSHNRKDYIYGVGGGIIWESNEQEELREIKLKASFLGEFEA